MGRLFLIATAMVLAACDFTVEESTSEFSSRSSEFRDANGAVTKYEVVEQDGSTLVKVITEQATTTYDVNILRAACEADEIDSCYQLALARAYSARIYKAHANTNAKQCGMLTEQKAEACAKTRADLERSALDEGADTIASFERACDGGHREACYQLGGIHQSGEFGETDMIKAAHSFDRGCRIGDGHACNDFGIALAEGYGVDKDVKTAARMFERGCDAGSANSCRSLGLVLRQGLGVDQNADRAASLFAQACDSGVLSGCNDLGVAFNEGSGVQRDLSQAAVFFRQACEGGYELGCDNLKLVQNWKD